MDFVVLEEDFARLDLERPLGISGHLRVKNEALSIAECIDSCIDFVDELIITYNDSEDNTEEILKKYAQKYKNKIRLYHYKPYVTPFTYSERFQDLSKTTEFKDETSIHNPANYYNFGYTKIKYKYYCKIDGDQIYFTEKLKKIRQAILLDKNFHSSNILIKLIKKVIRKIITIFKINFIKDIFVYILLFRFLCDDDCQFNMGGLNLYYYKQDKELSCLYHKQDNLLCYNGYVGDTSLWIPKSSVRYHQSKEYYYEVICPIGKMINIGACWLHVNPLKIRMQVNIDNIIPLSQFIQKSWKELVKNNIKDIILPSQLYGISLFWEQDRKYITNELYHQFLISIYKNISYF